MPMLAVECHYTPEQIDALRIGDEFLVLGDFADKSFQLKVAAAGQAAAKILMGG